MSERVFVRCQCGRTYNAGVALECPACGDSSRHATLIAALDAPESSSPPATSVGAAPVSPAHRPMFSGSLSNRQAAAQRAESQAKSLTVVAGILSVIGIIGGVFVAAAGLFVLADELTRPIGLLIVSAGIVGILVWIFIGTFAQTIAEGVRALAALLRD